MRSSFYTVEWLFADGTIAHSRTFATKRAATKFAAGWKASNLVRARVMLGGPGGMAVETFEKTGSR